MIDAAWIIARHLGMTPRDVRRRLTRSELVAWMECLR